MIRSSAYRSATGAAQAFLHLAQTSRPRSWTNRHGGRTEPGRQLDYETVSRHLPLPMLRAGRGRDYPNLMHDVARFNQVHLPAFKTPHPERVTPVQIIFDLRLRFNENRIPYMVALFAKARISQLIMAIPPQMWLESFSCNIVYTIHIIRSSTDAVRDLD